MELGPLDITSEEYIERVERQACAGPRHWTYEAGIGVDEKERFAEYYDALVGVGEQNQREVRCVELIMASLPWHQRLLLRIIRIFNS